MSQGTSSSIRRRLLGVGVFAVVIATFGVCEKMGWPFLAAPMQRWMVIAIARPVAFSEDAATQPKIAIHLLGDIEVSADYIMIGAPGWSSAPYMLLARGARVTLTYADLWRASRGELLNIRSVRAAQIDGHLERLADGRASWQLGTTPDADDATERDSRLPEIGSLQLDAGHIAYRDALAVIDLDASFSPFDGAARPAFPESATGLRLQAVGSYRELALKVDLQTIGTSPVIALDAAATAVAWPVTIEAHVGGATMTFQGTAVGAFHLSALAGRFMVQGPSLSVVGDPLHVTLPTTGPFHAECLVAKQGLVWNVLAEHVSVGGTRLTGAFTYDLRSPVPMLAGRLTGTKLQLADLGPVVGAPLRKTDPAALTAALAPKLAKTAPRRMLPDRPFDLPALRAMNANVLIDIADFDFGSSFLEPMRPLHAHLVLMDGVLTLGEIDARTGQGRLDGTVQLDGRDVQALWTADLRLSGVRLESWIRPKRADNASPFVTGSLNGRAHLAGQGRSTAAILASLRGDVRLQLVDGTISHLAVEAAGMDIAQGLGVLIKGDEALPVQCTVVDLVAEQGVLRPRVLVLDTRASTLWIDGSLSLATESIDLRVVVSPKDFSPLALRTPLHVRGTLGNPSVSLDKGRLGTRLGASALLGMINPLAALIPLVDMGSTADARRGSDDCRALSSTTAAKALPVAPSPARDRVARAASQRSRARPWRRPGDIRASRRLRVSRSADRTCRSGERRLRPSLGHSLSHRREHHAAGKGL